MSKLIEVFAVHEGASERHSGKPKWFFTDKSEADAVACGKGFYGSKAPITKRKIVKVDGEYYMVEDKPVMLDFNPDNQEEIKRLALEKLNDKEKRALGLDYDT